jgi:hypothetical protein
MEDELLKTFPMPGTLIQLTIYPALAVVDLVWTNDYLVQFTIGASHEAT